MEAAAGRTAALYLDELGRSRKTELAPGADYFGATVANKYDGLGRIIHSE